MYCGDGIVYGNPRELHETCRSGVYNINVWKQHARQDDVMDFCADLHDFIAEECSRSITDVLVSSCIVFGGHTSEWSSSLMTFY